MLDDQIDERIETHLRENQGIDAALLAADLGLCTAHIEAYQRRLGLRKLSQPGRRSN